MMVGGRDEGQLLLLAGIVLVMAFVVTAFTLSQVADVEKNAAKEQEQTFLTEYRFLHGKLPAILAGNTGRTTDNSSFQAAFASTAASFRNNLAAKGFDSAIYLASDANLADRAECTLMREPVAACAGTPPTNTPPAYHTFTTVTPLGGTEPLDTQLPYDGVSDGILWMCTQTKGAPVGAVVQVYMSDGRESIEETLVIALNHDWYKEERQSLPVC